MNKAQSDDLASELAYVRSLAEEGATAPLIGGFYYLLWGGLTSAAAFFVYAIAIGVLPAAPTGYFLPWIVAGVIAWVGSIMWGRRASSKPGAMTLGNQTALSVWFAVGVFMTMLWIALLFVHDDFTHFGVPENFLFSLMFPVAFGVYGVAFFATATAAKQPWLRWFAYLAWGFSIVSLFLLGNPHQFLAGGLGCALTAALPGALLMRREPGDIV
ncbi:hypothetical protein PUV54_04820 [Hyphococcus flavus]|uniref:Uncharacterized protein n=1 Tax=Hyphococcus flavus TaxID=1866326 RepID=A0AAF0CFJ2_9PROT|nr:hypothetical protein [Hyphococcus flavus]WDI32516.1 hypothetical protein PUV54_04820 [Hyphococcus flavus]